MRSPVTGLETLATSTARSTRCAGSVGVEHEPASEPPRAVVDHAYGDAALVVVVAGLQPGVVQREVRGADPLDPYVGVLHADLLGAGQRRIGNLTKWERGELRVDLARH